MQTKFSFLALLALVTFSCTKLDRFSDANAVTGFQVTAHSPEEIILDNVKIEGDTVFIPILYGKYDFPLNIKADVKTSPEVNKIIGLDFSKELILEDINTKLKFYVVAQSGATRAYYIRPREIPLDENNYIFGNVVYKNVKPGNTILSTATHPDTDGSRLELLGAGLDYPVTLTPEFNILPSSKYDRIWLEGDEQHAAEYVNGETAMTFEDPSSTYCLRVISQSGLARTWKISLQNCTLLDETSPVPPTHDVFVNPRTLSIEGKSAGFDAIETLTDTQTGSIQIVTRKPSTEQPLSFNFRIPANDLIDLVDVKTDTILGFESFDDVKVFYILDPHDKVAKKWTVSLVQYKSSQAQVLSFEYGNCDVGLIRLTSSGQANNPSITMDDEKKIKIYPQERLIMVLYKSSNNDNNASSPNWWRCTLKDISLTLSEGATCDIPDKIEWAATARNQATGLLTAVRTIKIVAEDGTEATWNVKLVKNDITLSSECEIQGLTISKTIPNYTKLEDNPVEIDLGNSNIFIKLKDDDEAYPMQLFVSYTLSDYSAIVSQNNGTEPLVFANSLSSITVTAKAQDGTLRDYTIQLIPPAKSDNADILNIDFQTLRPVDFTMDREATYDVVSGMITLHVVSDDADFPLDIPYNSITTSENGVAIAPGRGKFTFNKSTDKVPVAVRAQNGSYKIWYIVLDYRPQLKNWKLDAWEKYDGYQQPSPPLYWATGNNSFGSTSTSSELVASPDDYAAVMVSKEINVILTKFFAAGTLFNGRFDRSNILAGLTDPVKLTYFGIPFAPTAKIRGMEVDVWYHPGVVDQDWGSAAINLIRWDGNGDYVFHGDKPGNTITDPTSPHPDNNKGAVLATSSEMRFGTSNATKNTYGHAVTPVPDRQWTKVFIPVDGGVAFTHISIVFSSSCYGDYSKGSVNSTLKVNNVRIVYE